MKNLFRFIFYLIKSTKHIKINKSLKFKQKNI